MTSKHLLLAAALGSLLGGGAALAEDQGAQASRDQATRPPNSMGELFFRFDSSALPADAHQRLEAAATFAKLHPDARIVLDGHADPTGKSDYNVGLSIRRMESVRDELVDMGVPREQIVLSAYGEDGPRRATYRQDRRVTVWATRQPVQDVVDRTFANAGTSVTWGQPMTVAQIEGLAPPPMVASREGVTPAGRSPGT